MPNKHRKPFIFIVYQDSEDELAKRLKELFEAWGYDAYYGQQKQQDAAFFRRQLRENICKCDLVVLLLSREFRWSPYCQAEAGSTMLLEKPFVPIIVSPATDEEVKHDKIAEVLEGCTYISTKDLDFVKQLHDSVRDAFLESKTRLTELLSRLQSLASEEVQPPMVDEGKLDACGQKVKTAIENIDANYRLYQPKKTITSAWPSLADKDCHASIVSNIRRSLKNRDRKTVLVLVGVSLKFSLSLISEALKSEAFERIKGCDLRLMSAAKDISGIPAAGKSLIIVADVDQVLHFRIFNGDGKMVVDTDAKRLTEQARPIEDLRKQLEDLRKQLEDLRRQLESLWPPHELTQSEKAPVIAAIASIVVQTQIKGPSAGSTSASKKLQIKLVHMDSQSHILHAMNDTDDIGHIRKKFEKEWPNIYDEWKKHCAFVSIELEVPIMHPIDYIPPRVGILIDDEILYAGRCSFNIRGSDDIPLDVVLTGAPQNAGDHFQFKLDVGETPYLFYKKGEKDDPAFRAAMREFKGSVVAYSQSEYNAGISPIWESNAWIERLREYIRSSKQVNEITFVSATATKFESLIQAALRARAKVKIYFHDANPNSKAIKDLRTKLERTFGGAEILGYKHSPTFRAVVIGDVAIGLQPYISANGKSGGTEATTNLPLCLIITRCFTEFAELKKSVLTF